MPEELEDHEELVRALVPPRWDKVNNRVSASAFVDSGVSVSRTSVLGYEAIKSIFVDDLHNPPDSPLEATVSVTAGAVRTACKSDPKFPTVVSIVADPIANDPKGKRDNPSHALICGHDEDKNPKKITRGMSQAIINAAKKPVKLDLPN